MACGFCLTLVSYPLAARRVEVSSTELVSGMRLPVTISAAVFDCDGLLLRGRVFTSLVRRIETQSHRLRVRQPICRAR
jgi:hypothetical protein